MNEQREKFEVWGKELFNYGFHPQTWQKPEYEHEGTQMAWEGWQAAIASQAPRQALTDEEIKAVVTAAVKAGKLSWLGYEKDEDDKHTIPVLSKSNYQFARAIAAASGPNAALVAALQAIIAKYNGGQMVGGCAEIEAARAALAAVGVEL